MTRADVTVRGTVADVDNVKHASTRDVILPMPNTELREVRPESDIL